MSPVQLGNTAGRIDGHTGHGLVLALPDMTDHLPGNTRQDQFVPKPCCSGVWIGDMSAAALDKNQRTAEDNHRQGRCDLQREGFPEKYLAARSKG